MLIEEDVEVRGADVVIVGRSSLVGRPLALLLTQRGEGANATVTVCHTGTRDVSRHTRRADILIAAAGAPNTITADMVKENAVVIDVGVSRVADSSRRSGFRLTGDVDYANVRAKASAITPVPRRSRAHDRRHAPRKRRPSRQIAEQLGFVRERIVRPPSRSVRGRERAKRCERGMRWRLSQLAGN